MSEKMKATFFTVGDAKYFPGVVGIVNSLRRVGHSEEIVVLDGGFTPAQREALSTTCTVAELPPVVRNAASPVYYKLIAARLREYAENEIIVIIDSDIVVTSRLDDLIDHAAKGELAAFADPESNRWFSEWEAIFSLSSPPRRSTYFCSGLLVFCPAKLPELISQWSERCQSISSHPTVAEGAEGPTAQADQDALNAIMMSEYPPGTVYYEDIDRFPAAVELRRLRRRVAITDRRTLRCSFDGKSCLALHSASAPKPWATPRGIRTNAYVKLLSDMLTDPGSAVRVPEEDLPFWLRKGLINRSVLYSSSLLSVVEQMWTLATTRNER
jgi:hypothetical protein